MFLLAVYGDRTTFEKEYTESTHAHTITTAEHAQVTLPSSDYILSSRDTESAASQISQIQAALANHSQHAEAQAALAKMHSEIVKTVTTSAGHAPSSTTGIFKVNTEDACVFDFTNPKCGKFT